MMRASQVATGRVCATGRARAVFLDRDGVLNDVVVRDGVTGSPRSLDELRITAGAAELLGRLRDTGFRLFVVTNQPDLARGLLEPWAALAMMARLRDRLALDDAVVCPHDDGHGCACRKPLPGMIHRLAMRWGVDLGRSYVVGDRWRDVEAGRAAGCRTVLLRKTYNRDTEADVVVATLREAVDVIAKEAEP